MQLLRLPDGRDLEYEARGPSTGPVVLFHHGMPGSAVPMDTAWLDGGTRVPGDHVRDGRAGGTEEAAELALKSWPSV